MKLKTKLALIAALATISSAVFVTKSEFIADDTSTSSSSSSSSRVTPILTSSLSSRVTPGLPSNPEYSRSVISGPTPPGDKPITPTIKEEVCFTVAIPNGFTYDSITFYKNDVEASNVTSFLHLDSYWDFATVGYVYFECEDSALTDKITTLGFTYTKNGTTSSKIYWVNYTNSTKLDNQEDWTVGYVNIVYVVNPDAPYAIPKRGSNILTNYYFPITEEKEEYTIRNVLIPDYLGHTYMIKPSESTVRNEYADQLLLKFRLFADLITFTPKDLVTIKNTKFYKISLYTGSLAAFYNCNSNLDTSGNSQEGIALHKLWLRWTFDEADAYMENKRYETKIRPYNGGDYYTDGVQWISFDPTSSETDFSTIFTKVYHRLEIGSSLKMQFALDIPKTTYVKLEVVFVDNSHDVVSSYIFKKVDSMAALFDDDVPVGETLKNQLIGEITLTNELMSLTFYETVTFGYLDSSNSNEKVESELYHSVSYSFNDYKNNTGLTALLDSMNAYTSAAANVSIANPGTVVTPDTNLETYKSEVLALTEYSYQKSSNENLPYLTAIDMDSSYLNSKFAFAFDYREACTVKEYVSDDGETFEYVQKKDYTTADYDPEYQTIYEASSFAFAGFNKLRKVTITAAGETDPSCTVVFNGYDYLYLVLNSSNVALANAGCKLYEFVKQCEAYSAKVPDSSN